MCKFTTTKKTKENRISAIARLSSFSYNVFLQNFRIDGELTNVKADGLGAYKVNAGDFALIGMKIMLNLTWSQIFASTNYSFEGKINNDMNIFGKGDIT